MYPILGRRAIDTPIDRKTSDIVYFVDFKSPTLRDALRVILRDVGIAGLEADKPEVL